MEIARDLACRLADRQRVEQAIALAPTQTAYPLTVGWQPQSLAQGGAGIALSFAALDADFPDEGWDRHGHAWLAEAAEAAERTSKLHIGLFGGLAGLAFAGHALSRGGTRYRRLLATLDAAVMEQARGLARNLSHAADGIAFSEFDVVSGLAGVGACLLGREGAAASMALDAALGALVMLTSDASDPPRWWTPAHLLGNEEMMALNPHGNVNLGLAHGAPGPLALMALAAAHGVHVAGMEAAIDRLAGWLVAYQVRDEWGVNWPYAVPIGADGRPEPPDRNRAGSRAAWCYGTPGVARALWLAGAARARDDWRALAVEGMEAVFRRPVPARQIDSPTFCHGVAGLLQATLRFADETRLPVFAKAAGDLVAQLLEACEPETLMGYRNWEPGGTRVDQPGLLEGSAGVMLALLAAASDAAPVWDRAFLIA